MRKKNLVLFCGAGFSACFGIPTMPYFADAPAVRTAKDAFHAGVLVVLVEVHDLFTALSEGKDIGQLLKERIRRAEIEYKMAG